LNDAEWTFFEAFVIERGPKRGSPPSDHRRALEGIFWIARKGSPWGDLPDEFGKWSSVYRQFIRWSQAGLRTSCSKPRRKPRLFSDALQMIRFDHCAGAPPHRWRKGGIWKNTLGRSCGGFSTKIHLRTNAEGLPFGTMITAGEAQDLEGHKALMDETSPFPKVLLADRGYGANAVHADVENRGGVLMFPTNRIERCFNRLMNARRLANR
jgi:transposase